MHRQAPKGQNHVLQKRTKVALRDRQTSPVLNRCKPPIRLHRSNTPKKGATYIKHAPKWPSGPTWAEYKATVGPKKNSSTTASYDPGVSATKSAQHRLCIATKQAITDPGSTVPKSVQHRLNMNPIIAFIWQLPEVTT